MKEKLGTGLGFGAGLFSPRLGAERSVPHERPERLERAERTRRYEQYLPEMVNLVEVPDFVITKAEIDTMHIPNLRDFKIESEGESNREALSV